MSTWPYAGHGGSRPPQVPTDGRFNPNRPLQKPLQSHHLTEPGYWMPQARVLVEEDPLPFGYGIGIETSRAGYIVGILHLYAEEELMPNELLARRTNERRLGT